ncbi:MAG TPA: hypothetical protein VEK10_05480 [Steroidobacteraceae bacterium]|nr:hypothetical protein [Steroidobacteraceae bacterium]
MPEMALTLAPAARPGRVLHAARFAVGFTAALVLAAGRPALAAPPAGADASQAAAAAGAQPAAQPPPTLNQQNLEQFKKATEAAGAAVQSAMPTPASPAEGAPDTRGLDQQIQGLKKDVVDLNRDLFILEEELLFPANTQVAVFLSVDVGDFFALDSVQLKIDQKEVINYLYTPREVDALLKGGVQRLYIGNLKVGQHELVAFFNGKGPSERAYKRGASLRFEKGVGAKYLELKINDRQRKLQPEFEIKDWD